MVFWGFASLDFVFNIKHWQNKNKQKDHRNIAFFSLQEQGRTSSGTNIKGINQQKKDEREEVGKYSTGKKDGWVRKG